MVRKLLYNLTAAVIVGPELTRWRIEGARPRLWWRDDDAQAATAALDTMIYVANGRPLALAVVPSGDELKALADRLSTTNLSVGQHGIDHINRSEGPEKSEYSADVTMEEMTHAIAEGRSRLVAAGMTPIFYAPPWNAAQLVLAPVLETLTFRILSAGARPVGSSTALTYIGADIDLIRWKGKPRFRGGWKVLSALRKALAARRRSGATDQPIGLLTHHLDHDAPTWRFLGWFLTYADMRFDWVSVDMAPG